MAIDRETEAGFAEAMKQLVVLAVRMRRAQIESESGAYHAAAWARKKDLERHFDLHARELLGDAGEVRQPGSIHRLDPSGRKS